MPILLEGYPPPADPRLQHFSVTPDPGVIEVNIQPARDWDELVEHTTTLYDEARQSRLTTEKFMLDGRHTGTGGGNHFVLGGAHAARQPVPAPARSAAQPGRRTGTTIRRCRTCSRACSSARRARRRASTRRATTACTSSRSRSPAAAAGRRGPPPWLVDRALRHLLVDVTGNTHRAEFCIDKLYSPDGASGRRGLLELRAFEMPPHARMSLAQQLLLRALVARFWREPYTTPLVRWGTELHDRFMLPHFVWLDFEDVLEELRRARLSRCEPTGSRRTSSSAFRWPARRRCARRHLTLRQALEPWHVLGEEGSGRRHGALRRLVARAPAGARHRA